MQVFREAIEKNGGPLPLAYYLEPDVSNSSDEGPLHDSSPMELLNTRVDRRSFFECLLHDKNFAILNTYLVSGVSVNAVRDEDGATALHIAAAATLGMLNDAFFTRASGGSGSAGAAATASSRLAANTNSNLAENSLDALELEEDARGRTTRVLDPPCPNQLVLNFLIDNGADVNAPMRNQMRQTPLMVAAAQQNTKFAKLLLAKGADIGMQDALGRTALTYAARYPLLLEVFRMWMGEESFFNGAVRERLLHTVCRTAGNQYAALYLIEEVHLDVNARDGSVADRSGAFAVTPGVQLSPCLSADPMPSYLRSPVIAASAVAATPAPSDKNTVVALPSGAASGGPIASMPGVANNASSTHPTSTTAVEIAVSFSHSGDTPLHCAVGVADVALVRTLLRKGADVHAENDSGLSPLRLAQLQSKVGHSTKQHWKDEVLLLLQPRSPAAIAARRRRLDQRHECSPQKVCALLTALNNATPGPSREKVLQEPTAEYIWQVCTPMDYVQFAATVTLPHIFYYLCCCVLRNFLLLLCPLPLLYGSYIGMQRRDGHRPRSRPLTGLGWCFGYIVMQGLCLPLFTTLYYYQYYSFRLEEHAAITWWLIPSAIITFVLMIYLILISSPGVVTSSEGQRKGIYASVRQAKGSYPKELLYGIDLHTMVKKPLRAQYCEQLQRVVLRFDQYCTYFSTAIGGGNQRVFFWVHVSLLALLSCFYHYAREYHRMMSRVVDVAKVGKGAGGKLGQSVFQRFANAPFSTAELRFGYMYTQIFLPIMLLLDLYALYHQLSLAARNLTAYDLEHAADESSVYCFSLGCKIYTLYDRGVCMNLREFFGWSSLTKLVYRVPQINPYLQNIVEDHQRWQLTNGNGCCGGDEGHHHGHSHGSGNGDHGNSGAVATNEESIGPAEYGDDESTRHQQVLGARQQEAFAAAQSSMSSLPPSVAAATTAEASVHPRRPAFAAADSKGPINKVAQPQQQHAAKGQEGGDDEGEAAGDGRAPANSILALQIFQQMVRSGSTDVGRGEDSTQSSAVAYGAAAGSNDGVDAETQREWDAAVLQARQMFDFYRQSLGAEGED
ncbi:putative huntingtin interacting protein (HIP) [Leptomonas seymouri]|uniref:Putative huntingtin interacting protein (HIP) n=1 Tax=Leptomonas seymouri TaxID=5684 RepID=A0A0N1P9Z8_LEPSE|nr:putative huntingtin interacting protein (HIP) [Leptomonas seymouri]|eukprot:KPI84393.1 putative huntingtin interacting protein (HIP) [Leptomonas seymouri]